MTSAWDGLLNNERITQLPHYAINHALPEDTFFTQRAVARHCYRAFKGATADVNLRRHIFVEPSAGEGCFFDLLPPSRRIGLDIRPRREGIQKADFLTWYPGREARYVVIGNPPFGVRGAYALAFINRAFLFADVVAFILPMSFLSNGKGVNMKRVRNAHLIHSEKLDADSFYLPESGKAVSVNSVFQVWKKGAGRGIFADYDISEYAEIYTVCSAPRRRCGMGKIGAYDCYIASTYYKEVGIVRQFEEVKYGSGYGLIIRKDKAKVLQALRQADWDKYASDATNHCKHLRMHSIRQCLGEAGFGTIRDERSERTLL